MADAPHPKDGSRPDSNVELLFFSHGHTTFHELHTHPFYQLEIGIAGDLRGRNNEEWVRIPPGHFWLIPPEMPHSFMTYGNDTAFCSLKFSTSQVVPDSSLFDDVTKYYVEHLRNMLSIDHVPSPYSSAGKEIVERHLQALLDHIVAEGVKPRKVESDFLMDIRELVNSRGYLINAKALANRLECTRSQLKYKFMKSSREQPSIKRYLDQTLLELATSHLKYSDRSFTEIADIMNFPDLSQFSRFIKNHTGLTPGQFRRQLQKNLGTAGSKSGENGTVD